MKKIVRIGAIALIAFAVLGMSACEGILTLMASPTITVVDARTGNGISNVVVTLTPVVVEEGQDSATVRGTSGSDGSVIFLDRVAYGTYSVTGTLSGYVFVPFETTIAGWSSALGRMYGVATAKGGDDSAISIFLTWADNSKDVDAHFTYPADFDSSTTAAKVETWAGIDQAYYTLTDDGTRDHVYYADAYKNTTDDFAYLDVDDTNGEGPETITILGVNSALGSGTLTNVTSSTPYLGSILDAGDYYWMGAGEYYVDSWTTGSTLEGQSVQVVITQGSSIKGIFNIPSNMNCDTVSLFRVHYFDSADHSSYHFVFMPDVQELPDNDTTTYRSIEDIPTDKTIIVSGRR